MNHLDFATGSVSIAPSPDVSGTTVTLQSGEGSLFPAAPFVVTAHPSGTAPNLGVAELLLVTGKAGDTLTIERGYGISSPKSIAVGWRISNTIINADLTPVGTVLDYAGSTAPDGYLLCYGQVLDATTNLQYKALYDVIGNTFGGTNSSDFVVPDLRGRVIAGQDDMGGTSANRITGGFGGLNGDTMGAAGGAESHSLTVAEMPAHGHDIPINDAVVGGFNALQRTGVAANQTLVLPNGGNQPHNNLQPTIILNKIIKF